MSAKALIKGWNPDANLDLVDELADVASCTAEGIARFLHVDWDARERIARGACDWLSGEIDRAGGLLDEMEFVRRCGCRIIHGDGAKVVGA